MNKIDITRALVTLEPALLGSLWKECTPRILVVTDTLNYNAGDGFGLSQFVNTLRASTIHGMAPVVRTASRYGSPGAELTNYNFNDANQGLLKSRWDVVFLFGARSEGLDDLPAAQVDTIERFMQDGGGVFATGDHETLGAALCGNIARVRRMRKWKGADAPPSASATSRHSTNLSGADETETFDDQSDAFAQRLYLNYRTTAGGSANFDRAAHPLMRMRAPRKVLEVFPDHPHEGECVLPAALNGNFTIAGAATPEWPRDAAGVVVAPEMVAYSVSHGDGFPGKAGLVPRLFGAVAAYDGHRARVGRVVTDATWHHFININLDGTGSARSGFKTALGADTDALVRIRQYFVNLATWLMPRNVRLCLRFPLALAELRRYPLFEELDLPRPPSFKPAVTLELGRTLMASLARDRPDWEAQEMADDALEDALGDKLMARLQDSEGIGGTSRDDLRAAALGGLLQGMALELEELPSAERIVPHKTFEDSARRGAKEAVTALLGERRQALAAIDDVLTAVNADR